MATIVWDAPGEKTYHAGVDRGVLYLKDKAVPWNGLTGVDESSNREVKEYYLDGVKYLDHHVLGEYAGVLSAYTYPVEFEDIDGTVSAGKGLYLHDQRPKSFDLCYRTKVGNDIDGIDHGYIIHLLYNLRALPGTISSTSVGGQPAPTQFTWTLSSTPVRVPGRRPTSHVSIKSTDIDPVALAYLESLLYGTEAGAPTLPSLVDVVDIIDNPIVIVDNGDGTWTATGSENAISFLDEDETSFVITNVDGAYRPDNDYTFDLQVTPPETPDF